MHFWAWKGKLSDLLAKTKIEESENLNVTEWRGKKIAIRNEKIRVFLLNYREFQAQIDTTDLTDEEKLEKHGEIIKNSLKIAHWNGGSAFLAKSNLWK